METFKLVVFYLFLLDALGANLFAWTEGKKWYQMHFRVWSRWFPLAKGWTTLYLLAVIFVGWLLNTQGFFGAA